MTGSDLWRIRIMSCQVESRLRGRRRVRRAESRCWCPVVVETVVRGVRFGVYFEEPVWFHEGLDVECERDRGSG